MPHFIIEYSANLDTAVNIRGLVHDVHAAAIATGVFPLKGIRTRAVARQIFCIADGHEDNGFIPVVGRIGPGRPLAVRHRAGEQIFAAVCKALSDSAKTRPLAISFELQEIDADTAFRQNNLQEWLQRRGTATVDN